MLSSSTSSRSGFRCQNAGQNNSSASFIRCLRLSCVAIQKSGTRGLLARPSRGKRLTASATSLNAFTSTSFVQPPPFVNNSYELDLEDEPSDDLREMCALLLHQLCSVSSGERYSQIRVYARLPTSLGTPTAKLVSVASVRRCDGLDQSPCPGATGDDVVLLHMGEEPEEEEPMGQQQQRQGGRLVGADGAQAAAAGASGLEASLPPYSVSPDQIRGSSDQIRGGSWAMTAVGAGSSSQALMSRAERRLPASKGTGGGPAAAAELAWLKPVVVAGGGGSAPPADGVDAAVEREVLVLPHTGTLVIPLMEGGVLVGLLVMDPDQEERAAAAAAAALEPPQKQQQHQHDPWLTHAVETDTAVQAQAPHVPHAPPVDAASPSAFDSLIEPPPYAQSAPPAAVLAPLRLAVPLLAKACAMDLKRALQSARIRAQADAAAGALRDARRGASALNTLSAMLLPRMPEGQPDRDIAQGISMQGKRLQDLIGQLEGALGRPAPGAGAYNPSSARMPMLAGQGAASSTPFLAQARRPAATLTAAATATAAAARKAEATSATATRAAAAAAATTAAIAAAGTGSAGALTPPPYLSEGVASAPVAAAAVEGHAAALLGAAATAVAAAAGGNAGDSKGLHLASNSALVQPMTQAEPPSRSDAQESGLDGARQPADYEMRLGPHDVYESVGEQSPQNAGGAKVGDRQRTAVAPGAVHLASVAAGLTTSAAAASSAAATAAAAAVSSASRAVKGCDVSDALRSLLTAALRLGGLGGVHMIVQPPLMSEHNAANSSSGKQQHGAGSSGQGPKDALRPRPLRPLRADVPSMVLRRIASYLLDIALQCTPQGGQLCISAQLQEVPTVTVTTALPQQQVRPLRRGSAAAVAESSKGSGTKSASSALQPMVQLLIVHTGCMVLDRIHSVSGGSSGAVSGGSSAVRGGEVAGPSARVRSGSPRPTAPRTSVGSGLLSFSMAEELVLAMGGSVTVSHPVPMVNARSGEVNSATCIEVLLPARV